MAFKVLQATHKFSTPLVKSEKVLDIPTILEEHSYMIENKLSVLVLSDCDTTSALCRTGKSTARKVLTVGKPVNVQHSLC